MAIRRHTATVTSLYAELLDQLLALEGQRSIAHLRGGFTAKTLNRRRYWYFQYRDLGQTVRQVYIGPDNEVTRRFVEGCERERAAVEPDERRIEELAAMLRQGGMRTADAAAFRVVRALAESGLFRQGAVLVGTYAFVVIGNLLGVRWSSPSAQTQDIDLARDDTLGLALPSQQPVDVPGVLEGLEMGFLPVPSLNPKAPSTSFKVRGRALRLDLLTPTRTRRKKPVYFSSLNAAAQPLQFLDYLMKQPERAALVGRSAVLVNVPDPARFALHKLISSQERVAAFHAKAIKDREQAAQLLEVLLEDRPLDLESAWAAVRARGTRWVRAVRGGLDKLTKGHSELVAAIREVIR